MMLRNSSLNGGRPTHGEGDGHMSRLEVGLGYASVVSLSSSFPHLLIVLDSRMDWKLIKTACREQRISHLPKLSTF